MFRLLFLIAIVAIAVIIVMKLLRGLSAPRASDDDAPRSDDNASGEAAQAKLVRCVQCGAHVPRADASTEPEGFRCSDPKCRRN